MTSREKALKVCGYRVDDCVCTRILGHAGLHRCNGDGEVHEFDDAASKLPPGSPAGETASELTFDLRKPEQMIAASGAVESLHRAGFRVAVPEPVAGVSAELRQRISRLRSVASVDFAYTDGVYMKDGKPNAKPVYLVEDVAPILEALLAQPSAEGDGWIAVSERLPPECTVIACDTSRIVHIAVYRPKSDGYRWDCDTYGLHASDVTHWRPLPAPPMAKEGRES